MQHQHMKENSKSDFLKLTKLGDSNY